MDDIHRGIHKGTRKELAIVVQVHVSSGEGLQVKSCTAALVNAKPGVAILRMHAPDLMPGRLFPGCAYQYLSRCLRHRGSMPLLFITVHY